MYAISTAILIIGAIISYFQWRTSQQKVALDILESRYKIYENLRGSVSSYLTTADWTPEQQRVFMDAQSRARFHFGREVDGYLEKTRRDIIGAHLFDRYAARPAVNVDEQIARLDRLNAFYAEIDAMFIPYMRLNQRMPLWWWPSFYDACKQKIRMVMGRLPRRNV